MSRGEDLQLTTADKQGYGTEESDALLHNPDSGKHAYTTHYKKGFHFLYQACDSYVFYRTLRFFNETGYA